jgi:hypothetical protein
MQDELARVVAALGKAMNPLRPGWQDHLRQENIVRQQVVSSLRQDENDAITALTQRMDRLCSEMESVRQENVQLHARIAQLEKDTPSAVAAVAEKEAHVEAEPPRRIKKNKAPTAFETAMMACSGRQLAAPPLSPLLWAPCCTDAVDCQHDQQPAAVQAPAAVPVQGRMRPREAAAAAAEARAKQAAPTAAAKQEIIGRLQEIYKRQGKEAHWALGSLSLPRLKAMLKELVQERHDYLVNQAAQ